MTTTHLLSPALRHRNSMHSPIRSAMDNDDEHSDYMLMTPSHETKVQTHLSTGTSPALVQKHDHEQDDYADMTGIRTSSVELQAFLPTPKHNSTSPFHRDSSLTSINSEQAYGVYMRPKPKQKFSSSQSCDQLQTSPYCQPLVFSSQSEHSLPHPSFGIQEGSFNKDDEDDYADVETITTNKTPSHKQNSSMYKKPLKTFDHQETRNFESNDSYINANANQNENQASDFKEIPFRQRSQGMSCKSNFAHSFSVEDNISNFKRSNSVQTAAGIAARKVLETQTSQDKDISQIYEIKRTSSAGVVRSPSRFSTGVQSRINRNRQHQSLKQLKTSTQSEDVSTNLTSPTKRTQQTTPPIKNKDSDDKSLIANNNSNAEKVNEEKLPKLILKLDDDEIHRADSFQKAFRKVSDGAHMMKYIGDGRKTKSLDKNYMDWLVRTSPYVSRHASSASSMAESDDPKCHSISGGASASIEKLLQGTNEDKINNGDDEAFEKYKHAVSKHEEKRNQSNEKQKSSFWSIRKKDKTKSSDKKDPDMSLQEDSVYTEARQKKSRKSQKIKKKKKKVSDKSLPESSATTNEEIHKMLSSQQPVSTDKCEGSISMHALNQTQTSTPHNGENEKKFFHRGSFRRANSFKSRKSEHKIRNHSPLSRVATVPSGSQQSLNSLSVTQQASKSNQPSPNLKRHTLSVSSGIKNATTLSTMSVLDISLEKNYEEEISTAKPPTKAKHHPAKSHTLGRIFGRKGKERKSLEQLKHQGGSAEVLSHGTKTISKSSHTLMHMFSAVNHIASPTLPNGCNETAAYYMNNVLLVHGLTFEKPRNNNSWEGDDSFLATFTGKKNRTLEYLNKYATITGLSTLRSRKTSKESRENYHSKGGNKRESMRRNNPSLGKSWPILLFDSL